MIGVERLDEESRRSILKFFSAHVYWLKRFPSLHSSANNHRIAELAGLIVGLTMAPGAARRGRSARTQLARSSCRDRSPDSPGRGRRRAGAGLYRLRHRVVPGLGLRLWKASTICRRPPKIGSRPGLSTLCGSWTATGRCRRSAMRTMAASSQRPRPASRDMWPRSSPRLRAALADPTLLRRRPIRTFAIRFSDHRRLRPMQRTGLRTFPAGGYSVFRGQR